MNADWTKNPGLSGIDPAKLAMLQSLASQGSGKTPEETAQIDKMMHLMKMLKKQY